MDRETDTTHTVRLSLRALRLRTGYVLQQIALFPNLTVAENIALVPHMKKRHAKEIETRIDEWLERAGLAPAAYRSRYPRELSGGEQQRVGILRAIVGDPSVLLMDEPFSALDPISRSQLQSLIKAIHGALSMTTVFVTHDMNEALLLGDTICVMKSGEIVQVGTPDAIRAAVSFSSATVRSRTLTAYIRYLGRSWTSRA